MSQLHSPRIDLQTVFLLTTLHCHPPSRRNVQCVRQDRARLSRLQAAIGSSLRGRRWSVSACCRVDPEIQAYVDGRVLRVGRPAPRQRRLALMTMGVASKPKYSRSLFMRKRSAEKCNFSAWSVKTTKVGGRMLAWVM